MKILIANKFMYPRGGDCNVALNTRRLLLEKGHDVRLFAMQYPENLDFPDCSAYASEVRFDGGISQKIKALRRLLGKGDVQKSFARLMDEFKPDVVHLHNIHSYLSPIIGEIAAHKGARVVWTMHDYKLVCPAYSCRRPDGSNCEDCFSGRLAVVKHRCMKGSKLAGMIAHLEAARWHRARLEEFTDAFICPSQFMARCLAKGGFDAAKIKVLTNFADVDKFGDLAEIDAVQAPRTSFCYIGRLSAEKGVATFLQAAAQTGVSAKVAGDGPLGEELRSRYAPCANIEFLGHLDASGVKKLLQEAAAVVIPSEWYENNPLSVIEALCAGVPIIGAQIGGIPELIDLVAGSGVKFQAGNIDDLKERLQQFNAEAFRRTAIATQARALFSADSHYEGLMRIYQTN